MRMIIYGFAVMDVAAEGDDEFTTETPADVAEGEVAIISREPLLFR